MQIKSEGVLSMQYMICFSNRFKGKQNASGDRQRERQGTQFKYVTKAENRSWRQRHQQFSPALDMNSYLTSGHMIETNLNDVESQFDPMT